jgi:hypothetical protein
VSPTQTVPVRTHQPEQSFPNLTPQNVIELSDDDGTDEALKTKQIIPAVSRSPNSTAENEDTDSDPEIRELKAQARAKNHLKLSKSTKPPEKGSLGGGNGNVPIVPDPVIKVLIVSRVPDKNPLIVNIHLSHRFGKIKEAWCDREGIPREQQSEYFFTYQNRRVYDINTCKSLGVTTENYEERGQIVVEAVTEEIFKEIKKSDVRPKTWEEYVKMDDSVEPEPEPPATTSVIRINLKAKGYEVFKLQTFPVSS